VTPDFSQAKSYLEQAAYHADPRSAMLLGQMYRAGIGTAVDQKQAYAWSEVASLAVSLLHASEIPPFTILTSAISRRPSRMRTIS
jgi:hypothetical protein